MLRRKAWRTDDVSKGAFEINGLHWVSHLSVGAPNHEWLTLDPRLGCAGDD